MRANRFDRLNQGRGKRPMEDSRSYFPQEHADRHPLYFIFTSWVRASLKFLGADMAGNL